jgi:predicted Rossmann fold nucleotide-binding protein DprA/Smf involved in DNA uptake
MNELNMDVRQYLSDDGQALLALCSPFALTDDRLDGGPFTLAEWNKIEKQVEQSAWKHPAELQGRTADQIAKSLSISMGDANRIARLLERSGRMALELENIFSRGMWVVTRMDQLYPAKLRATLKHQAPTVLFGAGEIELLARGGVAVIGSRNIDEAGTLFAREAGRKIAESGFPVISGGARGTDRLAMEGSLQSDGFAIGALADSLEATIRKADVRDFVINGRLALLTPYSPTAGFSIGAAMGRNKVIYGLSDFAIVVSSDYQTGGTWAGASEALKTNWCPVFVRDSAAAPKGNRELVKLGGVALPEDELAKISNLTNWMRDKVKHTLVEQELFDLNGSQKKK